MIRWLRRRRERKLTAQLLAQVNSGRLSINEARARLGRKPWI